MNCQIFESVISDLARQQMVETGRCTAALVHCAQCPSCARRLEDQRALTVTLRVFANKTGDVEAPLHIEQSLVAALRARAVAPAASEKDYRWLYLRTAAAAVLFIFFAVGTLLLRRQAQIDTPSSQPKISKATTNLKPSAENTSPIASELKRASAVRRSDHSPLRPRRSQAVVPDTTRPVETAASRSTIPDHGREVATEFLPLGYGNALNLQDGGQIVRVALPRSTLASFGLPVNMNRVNESVKADLLLGADGSARAIRFVQ